MKLKTLFVSSLVVAGMMGTACGATTDNTVTGVTPVATLSATDEVGAIGTPVQVAPDGGDTATPGIIATDEVGAAGTAIQVAPDGGNTATPGALGTAVVTTEPGLGIGEDTDAAGVANIDISTMRASTLIDYDVRNSQGEDLGDIDDLMIDITNEQIRYAVLSFGGFLGIGDKLFAIPVSALRADPQNNAVIFDVDQEALENAPGFNQDNWPDTANPEWDVPYRDFWQDHMGAMPGSDATTQDQTTSQDNMAQSGTATPGADMAQEGSSITPDNAVAAIIVRASQLLGQNVENQQAEDLGDIEDLVVNLNNGQVEYAVLSFGGIANIGDRYYAMPLRALNWDQTDMVFRFDADETVLQNAPSFASDEWPNNLSPGMGEEARNFWDNELSMR